MAKTKARTTTKAERKTPSSRQEKANPKQFERFVEAAKKIGVDESPEALDRAFDRVVRPKLSRTD